MKQDFSRKAQNPISDNIFAGIKKHKPAIEKTVPYLFWLKSGRGSNYKTIRALPASYNENAVKEVLERWCEIHGCWNTSESVLSFGFEKIKPRKRKELLIEWDKICKQKDKLDEKYGRLKEMMLFFTK